MEIYDISKEIFSAEVYPGDPEPKHAEVLSMRYGDKCNLSNLSLGAHNGTHVDAPKHFINNGATIEQVALDKFLGPCTVVAENSALTREKAQAYTAGGCKRLLLKGPAVITKEGAKALTLAGLDLLGVEKLSVGEADSEAVHKILLRAGVVILESLVLTAVTPGDYFLCAQPLKLGGVEASPVRAVLLAGGIPAALTE